MRPRTWDLLLPVVALSHSWQLFNYATVDSALIRAIQPNANQFQFKLPWSKWVEASADSTNQTRKMHPVINPHGRSKKIKKTAFVLTK